MDYGTNHTDGETTALVVTSPKKNNRTYRYQFHLRGEYWVLSRPRDWYTEHVLDYAEREFDGEVLRRHLPASQTSFDDFRRDGEKPESASVVACESD
jgi:hypothetical protein